MQQTLDILVFRELAPVLVILILSFPSYCVLILRFWCCGLLVVVRGWANARASSSAILKVVCVLSVVYSLLGKGQKFNQQCYFSELCSMERQLDNLVSLRMYVLLQLKDLNL